MDGTDYTVPAHGYARRLPYAEIEVRQDHLGDEDGVERVADLLAGALVS
jgi:predicted N-formylglutamate amidohydrolase